MRVADAQHRYYRFRYCVDGLSPIAGSVDKRGQTWWVNAGVAPAPTVEPLLDVLMYTRAGTTKFDLSQLS